MVHVNGQQRDGDRLFGYTAHAERVAVDNEMFFAVHLSEAHSRSGEYLATSNLALEEGSASGGGTLGEITTRSDQSKLLPNYCTLNPMPEPASCSQGSVAEVTNFRTNLWTGFIDLTWNSNMEEVHTWNRFMIERRDRLTGAVRSYMAYPCSGSGSYSAPISGGDFYPNREYEFRIRTLEMRQLDSLCYGDWSPWVSVTTDDSFEIASLEEWSISNPTPGILSFMWQTPLNGQLDGYRIAYRDAESADTLWQTIADLNSPAGNRVNDFRWEHPLSLSGKRVEFRVESHWQGKWSAQSLYDFHYPARRSTEQSIYLYRFKIDDLDKYEAPELGMPEIHLNLGRASSPVWPNRAPDADAVAGFNRYSPCTTALAYYRGWKIILMPPAERKDAWYFPGVKWNFDCIRQQDGYVSIGIASSGSSYLGEWKDVPYNRFLGMAFWEVGHFIDDDQLGNEDMVTTWSASRKVNTGPKQSANEGGEMGYEAVETLPINLSIERNRVNMGTVRVNYWDKGSAQYELEMEGGSNRIEISTYQPEQFGRLLFADLGVPCSVPCSDMILVNWLTP